MSHKLQGKLDFQGLPISIENRRGSKRHWKDESTGESGSTHIYHPYGYIRGTLGIDGDAVDVYVGPNKSSDKVFVISQNIKPKDQASVGGHPWVGIDEQKVMLGFDSAKEAQDAYISQYDDPRFFGSMIELTVVDFKDRVLSQHGKLIKGKLADGGFTRSEASQVAKMLGVNLAREGISLKEWTYGLNEELEHKDVTNASASKTGKIAFAHLKEDPGYYTKLKKIEKRLNMAYKSATIYKDNISMLVLLKSIAKETFKPQDTKPGGKESNLFLDKAQLVDDDQEEGVSKSTRSEACSILRKSRSISDEDMDLKKKDEVNTEKNSNPETKAALPEGIRKALRAITVSSFTRRERLDAAYQLGVAQGRHVPHIFVEPAKLVNLNIGVAHSRSVVEPPAVPIRRIPSPSISKVPRESVGMESCTIHGYIHKSSSLCPLCTQTQTQTTEATPIWRR